MQSHFLQCKETTQVCFVYAKEKDAAMWEIDRNDALRSLFVDDTLWSRAYFVHRHALVRFCIAFPNSTNRSDTPRPAASIRMPNAQLKLGSVKYKLSIKIPTIVPDMKPNTQAFAKPGYLSNTDLIPFDVIKSPSSAKNKTAIKWSR